ncbi:stage III sporulation protein E, DNA translocase [Niallia circulans]|uniref:FtsK/SpoIIIE family DNA translocase n=1 Tax=Shouchella clausii TaxID=79880 RepID=UPI000D9A957C|nr:DNA translocase FtsK [Shouchella clausii]MCM3546968.1 DNA translocase FtsK [Shouchella clausii]SPU22278.1 stage III sporulation protein E, DNA translocase [Niallia circulans]
MAKRKKRKKNQWKSQLTFELVGLGLLVVALVTLARLGSVGEAFVRLFRFFLGEWFVVLALGFFVSALYIMIKRKKPALWGRRLAGLYTIVISMAILAHISLFRELQLTGNVSDESVLRGTWNLYWEEMTSGQSADLGGGMVGAVGYAVSHFLFANAGTYLFCFILIMIGAILISGRSFGEMVGKAYRRTYLFVTDFVKAAWQDFASWRKQAKVKMNEERQQKKVRQKKKQQINEEVEEQELEPWDKQTEPEIVDFTQNAQAQPEEQTVHPVKQGKKEGASEVAEAGGTDEDGALMPAGLVQMEQANESYTLPSLDLLLTPDKPEQKQEKQQLTSNARKLEKTLASFGVNVRVSKVHLGPAVTKYEVNPSIGVKVSKIVNLADDLALALAAKDIRIEAPIPGKSAVGIEVPNQEIAIVSLKEVLEGAASRQHEVLSVGLGRDISGEPVLAPLNKMPHLLVAGATGSGKSVCINGIITSILMKAKPHEVKLMMIDPKMVELNVYNGIPHLLTPVVTEPKKASQALKKVVAEMERRYDLFSHTGTRNIEGYNDYIRRHNETEEGKQPLLPYIVVIVDELADLMMVASGDVEDSIARLAQMARAAGIHMIIATQRPSVDVITGVIKANIPSRIAFGVSSQTDSRTILDSGGAEKLLGRGDMLYLPMGATKPTRIQGAFLSDQEVERVVEYVISQQKAQYVEEMTPSVDQATNSEPEDDLYNDAVDLVVEVGTASVSMIQRRFRVGYTRAARIIDEMEARGVVGPYEGSKPREVLISRNDEEATS